MSIGLVPYRPGIFGYFAEFYPGPSTWPFWSKDSVYIDGDVFFALDLIVEAFDSSGPTTFSGQRLDQLILRLEEAAGRISNAPHPRDLWPDYHRFSFIGSGTEEEWKEVRREFSLMLRELVVWIRDVKARKQPVTVHGA